MVTDLAPAQLGRGVILGPDSVIPSEFENAPVFEIDATTMNEPGDLVDVLHRHWLNREPYVIRLHVEMAEFRNAARQTDDRSPWQVGAHFQFDVQRLHFLVWNNNWDLRTGEPVWWWTKKAVSLGASECETDQGDVLIDGSPVFVDGGPVQPLDIPTIPYVNVQSGSLRLIGNAKSQSELAPDQSAAVHHAGGAARIIAPAGSGKTRVLTERLRHVLNDWHVAPNAVCAVAYNTRAAAELTERTSGTVNANIRTLNSLALSIVSGTGGFATSQLETARRTMVNERDVRNILQPMVDLPRKMNADPLAAWIEALSSVRLGLVDPAVVEAESGDLDGFAFVFDRYRSHLDDHNLLDFDEQIYRAIEILLRDPMAREAAQQRCRVLLVDEFQDLTPAHMLMLRLLATPSLDVFGVGDDDQVIYGYAGANPEYLVNFDKWFPGAASHPLQVNYRCPPLVVSSASNMLTRNGVRVAKEIHARPGRDSIEGELRIEQLTEAELATRAIDLITEAIDRGDDPSSIALLTRVNVTLLPAQVLLSEANIAHNTAVDASLLKRTGIRTALAYLRIGADLDNISRADITDTIRRPSRKVARNVVDLLTKRNRTSIRSIRSLAGGLTGNDGPRLDQYIQDLEAISDAVQSGSTADALEVIQDQIGLGDVMDVLDSSRREADRSTHADDLAALSAVAHLHPDAATFERWLDKVLSRTSEQPGGVELATVHRVKGREWDTVITYDASDGLLPHRLSSDRPEERRVFHVALTRARKQAIVLANKAAPSPFLLELDAPGEPEVEKPKVVLKPVDDTPNAAPITYDKETALRIELLKDWRRATAKTVGAPAYTIFHDSHLESIAIRNPTSLVDLSKCRGVGETKLERWGDEILAVLDSLNQ